jgi:hypothetical protein
MMMHGLTNPKNPATYPYSGTDKCCPQCPACYIGSHYYIYEKLSTKERGILRTGGLKLEKGILRTITNQELTDLCKHIGIVPDVKKEEIGKDWTCSKNGSGKDS